MRHKGAQSDKNCLSSRSGLCSSGSIGIESACGFLTKYWSTSSTKTGTRVGVAWLNRLDGSSTVLTLISVCPAHVCQEVTVIPLFIRLPHLCRHLCQMVDCCDLPAGHDKCKDMHGVGWIRTINHTLEDDGDPATIAEKATWIVQDSKLVHV